jgi:hypothetical protein
MNQNLLCLNQYLEIKMNFRLISWLSELMTEIVLSRMNLFCELYSRISVQLAVDVCGPSVGSKKIRILLRCFQLLIIKESQKDLIIKLGPLMIMIMFIVSLSQRISVNIPIYLERGLLPYCTPLLGPAPSKPGQPFLLHAIILTAIAKVVMFFTTIRLHGLCIKTTQLPPNT